MLAMSQFTHSIVLFTGDDGMPLEFNIQYCTDKQILTEMIEYGGGLCTHTDNAIYLVTPGTKVLNINTSKTIVSSKYIYDCVRENYLLDVDDYKIAINEIETSDLSEDFTLNVVDKPSDLKTSEESDNSVDITEIHDPKSPPMLNMPASNHAFDFQDSESRNVGVPVKTASPVPPQNRECSVQNASVEAERKGPYNSENEVPDSVDDLNLSENMEDLNQQVAGPSGASDVHNVQGKFIRDDSINADIVSSSQPNDVDVDDFDKIILSKLNEKPTEDCNANEQEEDGSQSYTVSSSADAQVSPKLSPQDISAEIFNSASAADSASQTRERQQYINNLEKEITEILKKPSPKSIQDKIVLVKYICCVKRLSPAIVLQTLQNF